MQLAEDLQAADAGQEDVEDEDVRLELLGQGQALVAVRGGAQHAVSPAGFEHLDDQLADGRLIFHDDDGFRLPGRGLHGNEHYDATPPVASERKRPRSLLVKKI